MKFDATKIIDFLQPTYNQLKTLLVISISIIGLVYLIGVKISNFQNTLDETKKISIENSKGIENIENDMDIIKGEFNSNINLLYNDLLELNTRNNDYMDKKINLLIKYGDSNKQLLIDLIETQNTQQNIYEKNKLDEIKYRNNILSDSLSIGVKKKNP